MVWSVGSVTAALGCGHTRPEPEGASVRAIDEIRAQHRTECVGFGECTTHPVPRVHFNIHTRAPVVIVGSEVIFPPGGYGDHAEALGEARRLALQEVTGCARTGPVPQKRPRTHPTQF